MNIKLFSTLKWFCLTLAMSMLSANCFAAKGGGSGGGGGGGGGGSINCKRDSVVDSPMSLRVTEILDTKNQGTGKLELSASGGSDRNGSVLPALSGAYQIRDKTGQLVGNFTSNNNYYDDLTVTFVEGLQPGETYDVLLASTDACLNVGISKVTYTMSALLPNDCSGSSQGVDCSSPVFDSDIENVKICTFGFCSNYLRVYLHDDKALKNVVFTIDGVEIKNFDLSQENHFWIAGNDSSSFIQGQQFSYYYPKGWGGNKRIVSVTATDLYGNQTTVSQTMNLPSQL